MLPAKISIFLLFSQLATAEGASPGKSGFFTTSDGVRLHYRQAGRGSGIVFVPGWTMPGWIWEHQIAHFARRYRVIAFDPRSQGESEKVADGHYPGRRARDIKELTEYLRLPPVILVGWSMGALGSFDGC